MYYRYFIFILWVRVCILYGVIAFYLIPDGLLRNYLQAPFRTKAGMTSAAENITESLRRTRQLMVQVNNSRYFFLFLILS